jgi:hypothetical protein
LKRDRNSQKIDIPVGERTLFDFVDEEGNPVEVVDFTMIPVAQFSEAKLSSREALLVLLANNTIIIQSLETSTVLLSFRLDPRIL